MCVCYNIISELIKTTLATNEFIYSARLAFFPFFYPISFHFPSVLPFTIRINFFIYLLSIIINRTSICSSIVHNKLTLQNANYI